MGAVRAIWRSAALNHIYPSAFKAALRARCICDKSKLDDKVFDLAYLMVAPAMPPWGNMNEEGWKKIVDFSVSAGIVTDMSKIPSVKEGVLWTNQ